MDNKVSVAFWLSSGFYSVTKALSTPLPCIMIIVLLEPAFLFFVLTSGRPLPVTTFFVFLKPLCSHFAAQIVIRKFSAPLQKCCLSLSKGFPLQPKFATAAAQHFYSSFVALLEAILQRCSSAARFVQIWTQHFSFVRRKIDKGKNAPVSPPFCFPSCFFCVRCLQFNLLTPLSKCLEQVRSYK